MNAPVTILRRADFSASHYFWVDDWTPEQNFETFGATANRFGHGHNYELIVAITGALDPLTGMVMNLIDVKVLIDRAVIQPLDFKCMNRQVPFFQDNQPSLEALSVYIYTRLHTALASVTLSLAWIEIRESRDLAVIYDGSPVQGIHLEKVFEDSLEDAPHLHHYTKGMTTDAPA
jgi:6-pyruvoyltetrahydropterin/6-carboxytetrahydropterin synthase